MGGASRDKGQRGERELAELLTELTGCTVRRRVRQHGGDSDLEGLPGWCIECKRHRAVLPGDVARWWRQTVEQATAADQWPLLAWRADQMRAWRFVWPAGLHRPELPGLSLDIGDTLTAAPAVWWAMVREQTAAARPTGPPSGPSWRESNASSSACVFAPVSTRNTKATLDSATREATTP